MANVKGTIIIQADRETIFSAIEDNAAHSEWSRQSYNQGVGKKELNQTFSVFEKGKESTAYQGTVTVCTRPEEIAWEIKTEDSEGSLVYSYSLFDLGEGKTLVVSLCYMSLNEQDEAFDTKPEDGLVEKSAKFIVKNALGFASSKLELMAHDDLVKLKEYVESHHEQPSVK